MDSKPNYRWPLRARIFSTILLAASSAFVVSIICKEHDGAFDLVYASKPKYAETLNARYVSPVDQETEFNPPPPTYFVIDEDQANDDHGFSIDQGDRVRFVIAKRSSVPWLEIESIDVHIDEFNPKTLNVAMFSNTNEPHESFQLPAHFVAEIDTPSNGEKSFQAQFADFATNEKNEFGFLLLGDDRPLPIVLTVQGKSPGIYTYSVTVTVKNLWRTQTIEICSGRKCMYRPIQKHDFHEMDPEPNINIRVPKKKLEAPEPVPVTPSGVLPKKV